MTIKLPDYCELYSAVQALENLYDTEDGVKWHDAFSRVNRAQLALIKENMEIPQHITMRIQNAITAARDYAKAQAQQVH